MKLFDKILHLQKTTNLNAVDFCSYAGLKIHYFNLLKRTGIIAKKEITKLCDKFNFDVDDFYDDSSTLLSPTKNEHFCKTKDEVNDKPVIYEDYAREDNSRYEERD